MAEDAKGRLTLRASPQGWTDDEPGWPAGREGFQSYQFESPWAAVDALERVLAELRGMRFDLAAAVRDAELSERVDERLEAARAALRALYLTEGELKARRGTYGRLADLCARALREVPEVVVHGEVAMYVRYLAQDLTDTKDPGFVEAAAPLRQALDEALARLSAPAAPAPGDLTPQALMLTLLEEVMKDGRLSSTEAQTVGEVRSLLGLEEPDYKAAYAEAERRCRANAPRGAGEFEPLAFYERILRVALADGHVTAAEQALLERVARALCVTVDEAAALRAKLRGA